MPGPRTRATTGYRRRAPERSSMFVTATILGIVAGCANDSPPATPVEPAVREIAWRMRTEQSETPVPVEKTPAVAKTMATLRQVVVDHGRNPLIPWAVTHSILALGPDIELTNGRNAVEFLFAEYGEIREIAGERLIGFPQQVERTTFDSDQGAERTFDVFVETHPDCFLRSCVPGHITGAAWIVSADHERCLLTHHKKLGRWLQLGGHADGEPKVHRVALREAQEESGMWMFEFRKTDEQILPLDIDVHVIPASGDDPQHLHYDIRFLLVAAPEQHPRSSSESHEVRWFSHRELRQVTGEASVLRMARKAEELLW